MSVTLPVRQAYAGPCGLDCSRCVMCTAGAVAHHAAAIQQVLGPNFATYADFLQDMEPALAHYPAFATLLAAMAKGSCPGCRQRATPCHATCRLPDCLKSRNLMWCAQCDDFPCASTGLPERLEQKWRAFNSLLREQGEDAALQELAEMPRYL